jgi:hypothetical protein
MTCRFGVPHHVISIAVTGRTHCDADTDRKKHLTAVERDGRAQVRQNTIRDDLRIGHVLQRIEENGKVVIAGAHCEIIVEGGIPDAEAPLQTSSDRREQTHVWALVDLFRTSNSSNVDQQDPKSKVLALLPSCDGVGDAIQQEDPIGKSGDGIGDDVSGNVAMTAAKGDRLTALVPHYRTATDHPAVEPILMPHTVAELKRVSLGAEPFKISQ